MLKITSLLKHHPPEPAPEPKSASTLVVQSYKTDCVSRWIRTCLSSVRNWAASNGYKYEFIGDRFFNYAPDWFRQRCVGSLLPVTDIARLYLLKEKLDKGSYERVVWIDADVAVFAPSLLNVEGVSGYALAGETWISRAGNGTILAVKKINNSVMVMSKNQMILDYLIVAAEEVVRRHAQGDIDPLAIGTDFLTRLTSSMPLHVLPGTATFSPSVILDIVNGGGEALNQLTRTCNAPAGAANLCRSLCGNGTNGGVSEAVMELAVDLLMTSRGDVFNGVMRQR